jgi:hypothetical protein
MRSLPGVTNVTPFQAARPSRMQSLMNLRQLAFGFQHGRRGPLAAMAEAQARRQLVLTALAIERYRLQKGTCPQSLGQLVPQFLHQLPTDFMDGQPLRYRPAEDGRFLLYSVGLDCIDNQGRVSLPRRFAPPGPYGAVGHQHGTDLTWPKPATPAEVKAQEAAPDAE